MSNKKNEAKCVAWNNKHPIGTSVRYREIVGKGDGVVLKTRSQAGLLPSGHPVIWLEGKIGCVHLDHCKPIGGA